VSTAAAKRPVVSRPSEGERLTLGATVVTIKLACEHTGGALSLLDYEVPASSPGPPLHVHPGFDEAFYVTEGELRFRLGEETVDAAPGTWLYTPGDTPHTFMNPSERSARMIIALTPGGFERFFRDAAAAADGAMPDPETMARLNTEHGVRVVG
jgi:quercetin dioxygenase-like cupin family protein